MIPPASHARSAPPSRSPTVRAEGGRLGLAISPYHLSTREVPAMGALLLGDTVATLLPEPEAGATREAVREAAVHAPRYCRLLESWRWSGPLWDAGVVIAGIEGQYAAGGLAGVYADIQSNPALSPLRPLVQPAEQRAREPFQGLDALCADLLRGGPDPGINIPICAAVDRFALAHKLIVIRGGMTSVAQRAEGMLGKRVFSVSLPMLLRAGGARVLQARADLHVELAALRRAVNALHDPAIAGQDVAPQAAAISAAAKDFARAFESWAARHARGDDENDQRVTWGYCSLTGLVLPGDAVLRSSRAAVRAMSGGGNGSPETSLSAGRLLTIVVREMNIRPVEPLA